VDFNRFGEPTFHPHTTVYKHRSLR